MTTTNKREKRKYKLGQKILHMAKNFIAFEKANIKCDNKQNSHEIIQNVETDTYFVCPEQSGHNKFYIEYLMKSLTLL